MEDPFASENALEESSPFEATSSPFGDDPDQEIASNRDMTPSSIDELAHNLQSLHMNGDLNIHALQRIARNLNTQNLPNMDGMQEYLEKAPLNFEILNGFIKARRFKEFKYLLKNHETMDPQLFDQIADSIRQERWSVKSIVAQMCLAKNPPANQKAVLQQLLEEAKQAKPNKKSSKSQRIRAKKERLRRQRMNRVK